MADSTAAPRREGREMTTVTLRSWPRGRLLGQGEERRRPQGGGTKEKTMWLFTKTGFYSIVKKPGDQDLTVRARNGSDLDRLRDRHLPSLGRTIEGGGTDYPYRAFVSVDDLVDAMADIVRELDYANFKSEVARRMGHERAKTYGRVWSALLDIEKERR